MALQILVCLGDIYECGHSFTQTFHGQSVLPASPVPGGPGSRAYTAMGDAGDVSRRRLQCGVRAPAGWNSELLHTHAELLANHFTSLGLNLLIDKNKDINGTYIIKLL